MRCSKEIAQQIDVDCHSEYRKTVFGDTVLYLEIKGLLQEWHTNVKKMHMIVRICREYNGEWKERLFPIFVSCADVEWQGTKFFGSVEIELGQLFMDYVNVCPEVPFQVELLYVNREMTWKSVSLPVELKGCSSLVLPKKCLIKKIGKRIAYVGCTLLLPVWLLGGVLAQKGVGTYYGPKDAKGKRAVFLHAQALVKQWTGYGYSIREYKTQYFRRQYDKNCKKIPVTQGILFLSERQVDRGGNLDRVRSRLQQEGTYKIREFLTQKPVHRLSFKELRQCAKWVAQSRVVILEDFVPHIHGLQMRSETQILQLWHACGAFKLFGLSELGKTSLPQSTRNHRSYSAAITSGECMVPFYSEAFGITQRQIRPIGVPRTDIFFDEKYKENTRKKLYETYPQWKGKKVVLFAPTFRGAGNKTAYYPQEQFPVKKIMERLPEEVVLVIKHHPFSGKVHREEACALERVFDLTGKENINDILVVTDVLITDYSSSIFEAALLEIPMIFYTFDLEQYMEERDLYFDFAQFAPGAIVETWEEMTEQLTLQLKDTQVQKQGQHEKFKEFFMGGIDGNSTTRTVELVKELYEKKEEKENVS